MSSNSQNAVDSPCTVFTKNSRQETAATLHLPVCVRSSLRKTENCRHSPFGRLCTVFTETNREAAAVNPSPSLSLSLYLSLSLSVCLAGCLSVYGLHLQTEKKEQLRSFWLSVHCLHWEEQKRNRGYSPFDCLFTVFTETNRKEQRPVRIWLSVHCLGEEQSTWNSIHASLCSVYVIA